MLLIFSKSSSTHHGFAAYYATWKETVLSETLTLVPINSFCKFRNWIRIKAGLTDYEFTHSIERETSLETVNPPSSPIGPFNVLIPYPEGWSHDTIGKEKPGVVATPHLDRLAY